MTSELKPCPFCGGVGLFTTVSAGLHSIQCLGIDGTHKPDWCGAEVFGTTPAEAIEAWNARAERTCERVTHGLERDRLVSTVSYTCSECDKHIGRSDNYCHNCGAKVVG